MMKVILFLIIQYLTLRFRQFEIDRDEIDGDENWRETLAWLPWLDEICWHVEILSSV